MAKTISLGHRLRYPITIIKLLKSRGDPVRKQEPLLQYSFKWVKMVGDHIRGETWQETQVSIVTWESPADGEILEWRVKEGDVIDGDRPCMLVEEACSHEIQFQGLCAICGKDMTEVNWASEALDTQRAPINMTHDQTSLTVSELQAQRAELELQRRLLEQRKLSLVVDLDQTIIHACIEPTIGEWQRDPKNPNYEAVKDVKSFQLNDDGPRGLVTGCWYYIKMRPGLEDFLTRIADKYELHVYTMGTRAYALNIAKIVDPQQRLFGNRVISRDENGSLTAKSLQRLFPVSTNMVVIIDDRADVWPRNRPNLIKVVPYDFFKGIGDINSSFLPKREDLIPAPPGPVDTPTNTTANEQARRASAAAAAAAAAATKDDKVSALEELASMSGGDDPVLTKKQIEEQARALEKQIMDRPLLHMQEKLDKEDEEAGKATDADKGAEPTISETQAHQRHHLLLDDDHELHHLERHLAELHQAYFEEYDRERGNAGTSIPDVGRVLDSLKARVLRGTKVVLSGLVPIGVDVRQSDMGLQLASFGAQLRDRVSSDVTHLVVSSARPRTQKVRQAARLPSIKIVNQNWLGECLTQWRRVDETPYLVDIHPADRAGARGTDPAPPVAENTDTDTVSDADDSDDDDKSRSQGWGGRALEGGDLVGEDSEDDNEGGEEGEEDLLPPELAEGQLSPVDGLKSFNWGEADEELDEFLASGTDDDDGDNNNNNNDNDDGGDGADDGTSSYRDTEDGEDGSRKRKLMAEDEDGGGTDGVAAKKQRVKADGQAAPLSKFREDIDDSAMPPSQASNDEISLPSTKDAGQNGKADSGDENALDIDEADLEADLLAEFEAEERAEREKDKG